MCADVHVACAAQGAYVAHSAAMLRSVLVNCARPVTVHFMHGPGMGRSSASRLRWLVQRHGGQISFHRIDPERLQGLPAPPQFTIAMWYRMLLPELLPDTDRVLYLDVDTIAMGDVSPLFDIDLGEAQVGAVENVFLERRHEARVHELGLGGGHGYFNSGVLLLALDEIRQRASVASLLDVVAERGDTLEWPDQDALNLVLGAGRLRLSPRWNCMNSVMNFAWARDVFGSAAVADARSTPGIRHFEGPGENKPWHLLSAQPHRSDYFHHRHRTPWPLVRPSGMTGGNLRRRLAGDLEPFSPSAPV